MRTKLIRDLVTELIDDAQSIRQIWAADSHADDPRRTLIHLLGHVVRRANLMAECLNADLARDEVQP